jgi:hypothetical protein
MAKAFLDDLNRYAALSGLAERVTNIILDNDPARLRAASVIHSPLVASHR